MKKYSVVFLLFLLTVGTHEVRAQQVHTKFTATKKAVKYFEEANTLLSGNKLNEALSPLQKSVAEDPLFIDAHLLLGELYGQLKQFDKSKTELTAGLTLDPNYQTRNWYFLTQTNWELDDYDGTVDAGKKYLTYPNPPAEWAYNTKLYIADAKFAKDAIAHPVPFNPVNLGDSINTPLMEYFPSVSGDEKTLVFTRNLGTYDRAREDFYISHKGADGKWRRAVNMGPPINTDMNEGAQSISASGTQLFYTGCDRLGGYGLCDLYFSEKINNRWTEPRNVGQPVNSPSWESQPSISADGKALYFVSGRPGGFGGDDIWVSYKDASGHWGNPQNLGPDINTAKDEQTPFIHPDNQTLYFSSAGHEGMGGADIYVSRRKPDGTWGKPVNLGYPVNTKGDENSFIVSLDGKHCYFSSDKINKDHNLDLYVCDMFDAIKPAVVTYLEGRTSNAVTGEMLGADVQLIDLATGSTINAFASDPTTGYYMVSIPVGKDYALNVSKKNFLFHSENFSLKDHAPEKPYNLDIKLQPVKVGESVVLKNIFFETNSAVLKDESKVELNKLVGLMKDNALIKIQINGHTDNVGTKELNERLSEARAKSVYDFLLTNGIEAARLSYKGFGDTKPIADNNTEDGRAQNRRTEFTVISTQ